MRTAPGWLRYLVIAGDIVYILWVLRNGINEGFRATLVQAVSLSGLVVLLAVNAALLYVSRDRS